MIREVLQASTPCNARPLVLMIWRMRSFQVLEIRGDDRQGLSLADKGQGFVRHSPGRCSESAGCLAGSRRVCRSRRRGENGIAGVAVAVGRVNGGRAEAAWSAKSATVGATLKTARGRAILQSFHRCSQSATQRGRHWESSLLLLSWMGSVGNALRGVPLRHGTPRRRSSRFYPTPAGSSGR